jgi:multicomponent K+:H+ antiporter subunit A
LLVEVATIILMMLALRWLPAASPPEAGRRAVLRRRRDALVALAAGGGVAALVWAVLGLPFDPISPYYLQTTQALGGGANTVNVILVDYRGFDTLGEITVLAVAGLIIHALLSGWQPSGVAAAPAPPGAPLMLSLIVPLLLPLMVLVAAFLFLRGHNLPGGGFIAGLVLAIALTLQFVAGDQRFVAARTTVGLQRWVGAGLLLAGATGVASWWFGAPFLTSSYDYPLWPLVGAVPLASASLFDLGVMLTVVGATLLALQSLARLGPPGARP